MKCQTMFSRKNKENILKYHLLKFSPIVLSIKSIFAKGKALLMSTHNLCFRGELRKLFPWILHLFTAGIMKGSFLLYLLHVDWFGV